MAFFTGRCGAAAKILERALGLHQVLCVPVPHCTGTQSTCVPIPQCTVPFLCTSGTQKCSTWGYTGNYLRTRHINRFWKLYLFPLCTLPWQLWLLAEWWKWCPISARIRDLAAKQVRAIRREASCFSEMTSETRETRSRSTSETRIRRVARNPTLDRPVKNVITPRLHCFKPFMYAMVSW